MTPLGLLNFVVLQWFGVRLCASFEPLTVEAVTPGDRLLADSLGIEARLSTGRWWSRHAPPRGTSVRWSLLRWIWPLTGWWSEYRWIACSHRSLSADVVDHHGGIREAIVKCDNCGRQFLNAREARAAGVFLEVDAKRIEALNRGRS